MLLISGIFRLVGYYVLGYFFDKLLISMIFRLVGYYVLWYLVRNVTNF